MAHEREKRVILSHQSALRQVRERIDAYAQRTWRGLGSWRDDDIDRFIAKIVPLVENGQKQTAQLTNAYLDSIARLAGMPPPPKAALGKDLRGVPLTEVYRRPAVTLYTALAEDKTLTEAVTLGSQRLSGLVSMDMQMANVRTAFDRVSQDDRIIGYERVLSGGETCALCAIASTQMYSRADLMPIHDNCDCDVAPVYASNESAMQSIRDERLENVQTLLKESGVDYSEVKANRSVRVNLHGEHGPTLGWKGQNFTGPKDITPKGPRPGDVNTWTSSSGRVYELRPSDPNYVPQ